MLSGIEKEEDLALDLKNKNKSMDINQKGIRVISTSSLDETQMMSPKPSPKIVPRRIDVLNRSASGKYIKYLFVKCRFQWIKT